MPQKLFRTLMVALLSVGILLIGSGLVSAKPPAQETDEELIARGEYLVKITGCDSCHTPLKPEFADPTALTLDQIKVLAFSGEDALDKENRYMAGGNVFDLGPAGMVVTRNLTPDEETGLGAWTDEEIKNAIRLGIARDGHQLFPIMPYFTFNNMAESDLDAIVAYLRSLEPVSNDVGEYLVALPPLGLTVPEEPVTLPDPSDQAAVGRYLVTSVLTCSDCHTPLDPNTGTPDFTKFLGGGQPFEGPWGIVYGGNITPHEGTGLADWTVEQLIAVMTTGVRPDGRRLILMPWQVYSNMTPEDLAAVAYFLKNELEPVDNEIPLPSLDPAFEEFVEGG